jgi:hypothetical protein
MVELKVAKLVGWLVVELENCLVVLKGELKADT